MDESGSWESVAIGVDGFMPAFRNLAHGSRHHYIFRHDERGTMKTMRAHVKLTGELANMEDYAAYLGNRSSLVEPDYSGRAAGL